MPDRIIRESWAIICEDGPNKEDVADSKDDGTLYDFASREIAAGYIQNCKSELSEHNACTAFRVARVRLSEVMEDLNA